MIEIISVGGYEEVGKNMTVVKYKNEAVVLDMGYHLPSLTEYQSHGGDRKYLTVKGMQKIGAIPDDSKLDKSIVKFLNNFHSIFLGINNMLFFLLQFCISFHLYFDLRGTVLDFLSNNFAIPLVDMVLSEHDDKSPIKNL